MMFWTLLRRSWVGFLTMLLVGGTLFMIWDDDDPLRSDDPHIAGFACGVIAAALGAVYTIAEKFLVTRLRTAVGYFIVAGGWTMFLLAAASAGGEGEGIIKLFAIVSAVVALLCWPLFVHQTPPPVIIGLSLAGFAVLLMYGVAVSHMMWAHQ